MKRNQYENLLKLRTLIQSVPAENVKMHMFLDSDEGPVKADALTVPGCGTVFCMLGAAALSGQFEGLTHSGWHLRFKGLQVVWGLGDLFASNRVCHSKVGKELFGLEAKETVELFKPVTWAEVCASEDLPNLSIYDCVDREKFDSAAREYGFNESFEELSLKTEKEVALERLDRVIAGIVIDSLED